MSLSAKKFSPAQWRVVYSAPAPGAWNMALDEAFFEACLRGKSPPTLRLYAWEPACLSLGYAQPFTDIDLPALQQHGWELVRRPTGGRAILHTDELTYSVCGLQDEPRLAGSVLDSYQVLAQALLKALQRLHIPAQAYAKPTLATGSDPKGPVCFEVPSNYEITVEGKKLIGSAQARRKGGVLQHGSLPLYGDLTRITQALAFTDEATRQSAAQRLLERATTAEAELGKTLPWEVAARVFASAFAETLNLSLIPGEPSPEELAHARQLVAEKYAHISWNERT
jgi:lipoate-protein ligase A